MTNKTKKTYCALGLAALTVGLASSAQANVSYTVSDGGLDTITSATLDGTTYTGVLTGGIQMTGSSGSFVSVCTDFFGSLYLGQTYSYNDAVTITSGVKGTDPTPWGEGSKNNTTLPTAAVTAAAIANAAKIFGNNYATLQTGTSDQKAAIQLAVWSVLYNTSASGLLSGAQANFTYVASSTVTSDVNALLSALSGYSLVSSPTVEVLVPTTSQSYSNPDNKPPQGVLVMVPVPEASTVVAGGLLLLPFALCSLKALRKSRV